MLILIWRRVKSEIFAEHQQTWHNKGMYWNGAHTTHRLRKRILRGAIVKRIEELLRQCAEINGWRIDELNIQQDHVHILIQVKPNISVSKAVQLFKGGSSKVIRAELSRTRRIFMGDGYFAETVGKFNVEVIKEYIKNQ